MMKTIDDLDVVQYNMMWNYLEDLDKSKYRSTYGKISVRDVSNKIKALVMEHHLYDSDWNMAILNLKYIYCKRSGSSM
jgi:hypothetical protein